MRIDVSSNVVKSAASLIGCSILTTPFYYLGVKVGGNMSRIYSWDEVISKVPKGVLNILESIRWNFFYCFDGEVALKDLYKRLYSLEMCKSISVAEKMGHSSLVHSFRRMPRGDVEEDHYDLLYLKVADLVLPNMSDRWSWSFEGSLESVDHYHVLCEKTLNVWDRIFAWWGVGPVDAFTLNDMICHRGGVRMEKEARVLWEVMVLVAAYYIWKSRNLRVFKAKNESNSKVFLDIQIKMFDWINRRSKKHKFPWEKRVVRPALCGKHQEGVCIGFGCLACGLPLGDSRVSSLLLIYMFLEVKRARIFVEEYIYVLGRVHMCFGRVLMCSNKFDEKVKRAFQEDVASPVELGRARSHGITTMYRMARSPYYRGPSTLSKKAGKVRSSVQDDLGYGGPMRRIRQKAKRCSQGSSLSKHKSEFDSSAQRLLLSYAFVPTVSTQMASKILEHLERTIPKEKPSSSRLARTTEKSATKLTSNLALGSLDKVESSKFLLSSQNNQ
ncbi:hypothetical protein Tco_0446746 [Tanacetum coccineum]